MTGHDGNPMVVFAYMNELFPENNIYTYIYIIYKLYDSNVSGRYGC